MQTSESRPAISRVIRGFAAVMILAAGYLGMQFIPAIPSAAATLARHVVPQAQLTDTCPSAANHC